VPRADIPVYIAAMGPAMTRLAGTIGDGWISHELCSPRYLAERVLPELETGIARAEVKRREDVEIVVSACCSESDDRKTALRRLSGLVGFYASVRTYADFFHFHGLAESQQAVVVAFRVGSGTSRLSDAFRGGTGSEHLADAVSPEMVDALTMTGGRDEVAERIAAYEGLADAVKLSPPTHGLSAAETRAAQDELLSLLPDLTGSAS